MNQTKSFISVSNITKSFGDVHALAGVDLTLKRGQVLGLLGPNGAGKTTLVRIMTTLLSYDSGSVTIAGIEVKENPAAVRAHIGLTGQYAAIDENLTGRENLIMVGRLYHMTKAQAIDKAQTLLQQFSLVEAADRRARTYSGGMRRRLDLAASLVGDPEVLFLDEPTTGLDPRSRTELWEVIKKLVARGVTVLLTTQYLEEADYLADQIVVIDHGRVIAQGTADELKQQVGSGVVQIRCLDEAETNRAYTALSSSDFLVHEQVQMNQQSHMITIPAVQGAKTLVAAVQCLTTAEIEIHDIELRKPTLDEVFLSLT